jgi:hypothetical protein
MMARPIERLRELAHTILDERLPTWSLGPEVRGLASLMRAHATVRIDPSRVSGDGETVTAAGRALSPTMAGRCADDIARTAVFIRGLRQAIERVRRSAPDRPARVLYAGCGPYALIAVPAMAVLDREELQVTLLDIHGASIESAQAVIDAFGLGGHVAALETMDACEYRIPPDQPPDIILSETMNVCLGKEPQVMITRHLHAQAPRATLVPEVIRVIACLLDPSREFNFVEAEQGAAAFGVTRDRVSLGTVFELSARTVTSWRDLSGDRLPAASVSVPSPLDERYVPMLLTEVVVQGEHVLRDYDSGLTLPQHVPLDAPLRGGETLAFHYRLGSRPGLVCGIA